MKIFWYCLTVISLYAPIELGRLIIWYWDTYGNTTLGFQIELTVITLGVVATTYNIVVLADRIFNKGKGM